MLCLVESRQMDCVLNIGFVERSDIILIINNYKYPYIIKKNQINYVFS